MTLRAESLTIARGGRPVVEHVSAALEPGTITAICGPNGAGKSSLLLALAGLLTPASGLVMLGDVAVNAMQTRSRAKAIGYLPQEGEVAWDVAVESLVRLGRLPHRDEGHEAVEAAIASLDLQALRDRPVSKLSGGERARALLARGLAGQPDWILADEPLAALDLAHQQRLLAQLRKAADDGAGVALVLHDLSLAMNHADRVLVLQQGRLAASATPDEGLSPDILAAVWGVDAHWLGVPGARALAVRAQGESALGGL